ncbi:bifunctional uridylyltransferase/uridylyl-removing enzyme [Amylibacter marinus]|uniref:Bifunctional uridylyltransferase/uridylyl-removing enzyme n=2 Tax=Amylibacter marinus TaxID=1475483 RepID=A0ABQ5VUQ2_9RHOB|nr:bifunctional uridylyltransferase/uridylyl-removing enzyme [Amylibacter marinus]
MDQSQVLFETGALIGAPELLFDAQEFYANVRSVFDQEGKSAVKAQVAKILSQANTNGRAFIEQKLTEDPYDARRAIHSYSYLTDCLVAAAYDVVATYLHPNPTPTKNETLSIVCVGGYGRGEMAPFSDVDLLFLTPNKISPWAESTIESMLYILWDMKLKIGHSTRSEIDCVRLGKADQTIKTALMECRYLCGNEPLYDSLQKRMWHDLFKAKASDYVDEKLEERAARHARQGGQRYVVEPNVKEGKGGLRDLQSLFWITKYVAGAKTHSEMIAQGYFTQDEYDAFEQAHEFLWTTRCHLHLAAGRATEQLTFDQQVDVAQRLGYKSDEGMRAVEHFMQDYFRHATHVGELTRVFITALEAQHLKETPSLGNRLRNMVWRRNAGNDGLSADYALEQGRINLANPDTYLDDPVNILRLFEAGLRTGYLIHQDAMRVITANLDLIDDTVRASPEARRIFMSLMLDYGNPERALRRMNELGVLGAFIPEFKRIIALMQFNIYHHYTVDEHTIQCISVLARIEEGELEEELPIVSKILDQGVNRRVLYVALLLHDIGKGLPEDHSIAGARLAGEICPALGMNEAETEIVVWLVESHLIMSDFAQKRDLSDPRTVSNFAAVVKSTSRLKLLTVLTACDIMGVGPGTLNNWRAQLIRELYLATRDIIKGGLDTQGKHNPVHDAHKALATALPDWDKGAIDTELARHYDHYWQGLDTTAHVGFAEMLRENTNNRLITKFEQDPDRDATRAMFAMQDHPGIVSRIAGALALANANVVDARSYTSSDGFATLLFWIQDDKGHQFSTQKFKRLRETIEKILHGDVIASTLLKDRNKLKKRERDFQVPTEIVFDNQGSEYYTIIEVDTRDRPSLLYDLTRTLTDSNIQIDSAVIATYGVQAVDVFYVKDIVGLKIHSRDKQKKIAKRLEDAIQRGAKAAMA